MSKQLRLVGYNPLAPAALLALLAGCSTPAPVNPSKIAQAVVEQRPPPPQPVFGDMDHALACLGDRLREQKVQPLLIGYSAVTDTTGKLGVDLPSILRSSMQ